MGETDARQARRTLDASEKGTEEHGIDAEVHEFSKHFRDAQKAVER
jgi:hypothetical protein